MTGTPICELPGYLSSDPDVDRLLDNVGALVPGLLNDVLMMVVWNTIEDFYMRSTYRREHLYWRMDPGVLSINFDPYDSHWRVSRFMDFTGLSNPKFEPPGRVRDLTYPPPDTLRSGEVLLALKPASINTPLPYDVWTTYFQTLLDGVLYRLYMQPGKPYSDLNAMRLHAAAYRGGCSSARAEAQAHHIREGSSWSYPYFAAGGHPNGRR